MEQKKHLARFFDRFLAGIRRFSLAGAYTAAMVCYAIGYTAVGGADADMGETSCLSFVCACLLGTALSVFVRLFLERRGDTSRAVPYGLVVSLPCATTFFLVCLWGAAALNTYAWMIGIGVGAAAALASCALLAGREGAGPEMRALLGALVPAGAVALAVLGGLLLSYAAIDALLVSVSGTVMEAIAAFALAVGVNVFLAGVPRPGEAGEPGGFYRGAIRYVLLPLYLLLLAVLYLYIGKIAVAWSMPSGEMTPYGLAATAGFLFLWLTLRGETGKLTAWYVRFGGLLLLPVIAVQLVGMGIRVSAYGLTTARYLTVAFALLGAAGALLALLRARTRTFLLVAAGVALLVTATPLNAYDVPIRAQEHRLGVLLRQNGMLAEDGTIVAPKHALTQEVCERIEGSYAYLRYSDGRRTAFAEAAVESGVLQDVYAYAEAGEGAPTEPQSVRVWTRYYGGAGYDISGCRMLYPLNDLHLPSGAEAVLVWHDPAGREITAALTEELDALLTRYPAQASGDAEDAWYPPEPVAMDAPIVLPVDGERTILLTEVELLYDAGTYRDVTVDGFVLEK